MFLQGCRTLTFSKIQIFDLFETNCSNSNISNTCIIWFRYSSDNNVCWSKLQSLLGCWGCCWVPARKKYKSPKNPIDITDRLWILLMGLMRLGAWKDPIPLLKWFEILLFDWRGWKVRLFKYSNYSRSWELDYSIVNVSKSGKIRLFVLPILGVIKGYKTMSLSNFFSISSLKKIVFREYTKKFRLCLIWSSSALVLSNAGTICSWHPNLFAFELVGWTGKVFKVATRFKNPSSWASGESWGYQEVSLNETLANSGCHWLH